MEECKRRRYILKVKSDAQRTIQFRTSWSRVGLMAGLGQAKALTVTTRSAFTALTRSFSLAGSDWNAVAAIVALRVVHASGGRCAARGDRDTRLRLNRITLPFAAGIKQGSLVAS